MGLCEADGHDTESLVEAVAGLQPNRPKMIVAKTIKGKGVSFMEGVPIWHYRSPTPEEFSRAIREIDGSNA